MVQSLYKSWVLVSKITWGIKKLQTSSGKSKKLKFNGLYPKTTFLLLKYYIQRIYLTLLSTTCVKIRQITYVIFETISRFSRHISSWSSYLKHYMLYSKVAHQNATFPLLRLKFTKSLIPHVIFQIKVCFFIFQIKICFQCRERFFWTLLYFFNWNFIYLSRIVIEVIETVFYFLWRNFKHLKHKWKHLK